MDFIVSLKRTLSKNKITVFMSELRKIVFCAKIDPQL